MLFLTEFSFFVLCRQTQSHPFRNEIETHIIFGQPNFGFPSFFMRNERFNILLESQIPNKSSLLNFTLSCQELDMTYLRIRVIFVEKTLKILEKFVTMSEYGDGNAVYLIKGQPVHLRKYFARKILVLLFFDGKYLRHFSSGVKCS